jgi:predicted DNA-binding transcriptional regulator YafY
MGMRLDRLLSIVMLLINRKRIQAKELAGIFEVSVRTIYRDIEVINQAGIPIVTVQGVNGGLGIVENYRIDRNVLCQDDIVSILSALQGLNTTMDSHKVANAIEKIKGIIPEYKSNEFREKSNQVMIDLSLWEGNEVQKIKIKLIREAIEDCRLISFAYSNATGIDSVREVEPMCLVLKIYTWYLWGFCKLREDFRFFRLSRMKNVRNTGVNFVKKDKCIEEYPWEKEWSKVKSTEVILRFAPRLKSLIEERFGIESIAFESEGYMIVKLAYPEDDWLYGMILSYAEGGEVLEPMRIKEIIKEKSQRIYKIYEKNFEET